MEVSNHYVTIKHDINGSPAESDFELRTTTLALAVLGGSKDVIVKNLYVSIDPYQLNRMKSDSSSRIVSNSSTRIVPGQAINAHGVGRVVASDNPEFEIDDFVVGLLGWEEYSVVKGGDTLSKISSTEFPLSLYAGIFGTSGLTAYVGFFNVCKPKKGEKVFVSAASGSVDMLKDQLGFDNAFNYKEEIDLKSTLKRYFPDGIDIYFDNVGGEMLEAAVANMNAFGRVALCGVISEYTDKGRKAAPDMLDVVYKRISINGFLLVDYLHMFGEFMSITSEHLRHKRMHALEDVSQGIESVPSAFVGLFRGLNVGKKLVEVTKI
ncbi:NADP-dependent alkenal double bond reductase P2 [Acorus calamus]|uniref:NADP-dependent alkenal double bond reductase P2 n=1 Tax=Acorus calamus TaxID=4465 RepID=A0AAV9E0Y5_ACOCL|nr:NADP-dependent alkenal double bond reductase P2 [Acorus calamus]